jgi:hypothetical protein
MKEVTIPVFTTSRPGMFCDTSDRNKKFIEQMSGEKKLFCENLNLYIDGQLEDILGFDIPIWLSGEITGETQQCEVWDVEGKNMYNAEITYGHEGGFGPHVYIRLKNKET